MPVGAGKLSLKPTGNTSIDAFYQFTWEQTYPDPVGSYFSTTDLAGGGADKVMLGFGSAPDTMSVRDGWRPASIRITAEACSRISGRLATTTRLSTLVRAASALSPACRRSCAGPAATTRS